MAWQDHIAQAAAKIASSERLIVLTGAGISKESGIPTFRDALDGLWAKYDPTELATPTAFERNPKLVWDWYAYRRALVERCQPNPGHYALAQLDDLIPHCVVITQNVDGFHALAGSSDVIELHGNIKRYKCSRACKGSPTLVSIDQYQVDQVPLCPHCEGLLRPDVVWFGENLPQYALYRAIDLVQNADILLVVGTSGMVNPAAAIPGIARQHGASVIDVNPQSDNFLDVVEIFIQAPSGEALPVLVNAVRDLL